MSYRKLFINTTARRKASVMHWHGLPSSDRLQIVCSIHRTCRVPSSTYDRKGLSEKSRSVWADIVLLIISLSGLLHVSRWDFVGVVATVECQTGVCPTSSRCCNFLLLYCLLPFVLFLVQFLFIALQQHLMQTSAMAVALILFLSYLHILSNPINIDQNSQHLCASLVVPLSS
jgi:hypothetical protein